VVHGTIESQGPLVGRLFLQYFFTPSRANAMILFYVRVSHRYASSPSTNNSGQPLTTKTQYIMSDTSRRKSERK
jgi:hypothetical protein